MRLAAVLAIVFASRADAQPGKSCQLSGTVSDPTGATVVDAVVIATSRDGQIRRSARSGLDGRFQIEAPCPAEYLLEARAEGLGARPSILRVPAGQGASVDLRLELARVDGAVTVTATGTPQRADEIAKALDVIEAPALERRAEFSLVEALRLTPGLRALQFGGPGSFVQIQTRGMRAADTALLIDGFRFRDAAAVQGDASGYLGDLMMISADRIEVLRGSGASLYGTNAIGGAVNLVTDSGGGPTHGSLLADGGGLGLFRGLGKLAGGWRQDRLRYAAGLTHVHSTRGVDGDDRYRNTSGQGFLEWRLSPAASLSGRVFAGDAFLGLNDLPFAASPLPASGFVPAVARATFFPAPNDPDSRRVADFFSGLVAFSHRPAPGLSYRLGYQALVTDRDNLDGPAGTRFEPAFQTANRFFSRIDTLQARADLETGRGHLLSAAWEFEREFYDNHTRDRNPAQAQRVDARVRIPQRSHTVFVQDQARFLADRLQLSLSGRWQNFQLDHPQFTGAPPRFQGAVFPSPPNAWTGDAAIAYLVPRRGTKLRAHAGNGYRVASLFERFGTSFFGGSFSAFGNPRLKPERSIAFDAGVDRYFASARYRLSGTYFYTRLQEVIGFGSSGYINTGGGLARGVEVSFQGRPARSLTMESSYTHTNADDRVSRFPGGELRSLHIFNHMFTVTATQSFARRWEATVDFLAASEYLWAFFATGGNRGFLFPGPRKADAVIAYTLPLGDRRSLRLYGKAENFLNRSYYEDGFPTPRAWAVFGLRYGF